MSTPSKITRPEVGSCSPVMTLKHVVLPAPLGPISPVTALASASTLASDSARRPPKRTTTSSVDNSAMRHLRPVSAIRRCRRQLVRHAEQRVELGHLLDRERPRQAEFADLVTADILVTPFGLEPGFLLPRVTAPRQEPGQVTTSVK